MANVDLTNAEIEDAIDTIKNMAANGIGGFSDNQPKKLVVSADMLRAMSKSLRASGTMNKKHTVEVEFDGDADDR